MIKKIDLENHFYDISSVEALQSRAKGDYPYWDKETNTIHWLEGIAMCQVFEQIASAGTKIL